MADVEHFRAAVDEFIAELIDAVGADRALPMIDAAVAEVRASLLRRLDTPEAKARRAHVAGTPARPGSKRPNTVRPL